MELYSIPTKSYKNIFFSVLSANIAAIIISYLLVTQVLTVIPLRVERSVTTPILLIMVAVAFIHSGQLRKKLNKLHEIEDFEEKLKAYEKIYKFRMMWHLGSVLVTCLIFVLTSRYYFFYWVIFDLLVSLPGYPSRELFKRELKNEEVILVDK